MQFQAGKNFDEVTISILQIILIGKQAILLSCFSFTLLFCWKLFSYMLFVISHFISAYGICDQVNLVYCFNCWWLELLTFKCSGVITSHSKISYKKIFHAMVCCDWNWILWKFSHNAKNFLRSIEIFIFQLPYNCFLLRKANKTALELLGLRQNWWCHWFPELF